MNNIIDRKGNLLKQSLLAMTLLFSAVGCSCGSDEEETEETGTEEQQPAEEKKPVRFKLTGFSPNDSKTTAYLDAKESTDTQATRHTDKTIDESQYFKFFIKLEQGGENEQVNLNNYRVVVLSQECYKKNDFKTPENDRGYRVMLNRPLDNQTLSNLLGMNMLEQGIRIAVQFSFKAEDPGIASTLRAAFAMARSAKATIKIIGPNGEDASEELELYWSQK